MMRKHLYFNSSNFDYIEDISADENFEPVYNYINTRKNVSPYEWGRIKTPSLYIHLIMGHIIDKNCPWCGCGVSLTPLNKDNPSDPFHKLVFCMECPRCGARGPTANIDAQCMIDKNMQDEVRKRIEHMYTQRKAWDETEYFIAKDEG